MPYKVRPSKLARKRSEWEKSLGKKNAEPCQCSCQCGAINGYPVRPGGTRCRRCEQTCRVLPAKVTREPVATSGVVTREEPVAIPPPSPRARQCAGCGIRSDEVAQIRGGDWHSGCYARASFIERQMARRTA